MGSGTEEGRQENHHAPGIQRKDARERHRHHRAGISPRLFVRYRGENCNEPGGSGSRHRRHRGRMGHAELRLAYLKAVRTRARAILAAPSSPATLSLWSESFPGDTAAPRLNIRESTPAWPTTSTLSKASLDPNNNQGAPQ